MILDEFLLSVPFKLIKFFPSLTATPINPLIIVVLFHSLLFNLTSLQSISLALNGNIAMLIFSALTLNSKSISFLSFLKLFIFVSIKLLQLN